MKNTLIQFCSLVEYSIVGVEADSGVDIPDKTGLKSAKYGASRMACPHAHTVS